MPHAPVRLAIDHLAVACKTLAEGAAHVEAALGAAPGPGGQHTDMGTHNRLMSLGTDLYLEAIAPDPEAPAPGRARFFELDRAGPPRLAHWIARVDDIEAAIAAAPVATGPALAMSRGALSWRLTAPQDGHLPMRGLFPSLIEWPDIPHPATRMADAGCRLTRLELEGPGIAALAEWFAAHCPDPRLVLREGPQVRLRAAFDTPRGPRMLE